MRGNKKGFAPLVAILIVVLAGVLMSVSGGLTTIYGMLTGPKHCAETPYDMNCFCDESTENKVLLEGFITPLGQKYICEKADLFLDPESATFQSDALAHTVNMLGTLYPGCGSISCSGAGDVLDQPVLANTIEGRGVYTECRSDNGISLWDMNFRLADGMAISSHCTNRIEGTPDQTYQDRCTASASDLFCCGIYHNDGIGCSTCELYPVREAIIGDGTRQYLTGTLMAGNNAESGGVCGDAVRARWQPYNIKDCCYKTGWDKRVIVCPPGC